MWGQISSLRTGEKRICELCDKYGADVVKGSMERLVSQGEKVARRRLAEMPKGTWEMMNTWTTMDMAIQFIYR